MGEEPCNTGLALGLWGGADLLASDRKRPREPVQFHILFPPCAKEEGEEPRALSGGEEEGRNRSMPRAATEVEGALESSRKALGVGIGGDNAGRSGSAGKKLRLTKEQSSLLEDSFREHSTLTPTQKQELAGRLNLRPRQVEVWFQNRRARTKLKQTEEDCEFLKKCCESLSDENRRLKKEVQDLRTSLRHGWPFHLHLPKAASPAMCPSCERITTGGGKGTAPGGIAAPPGRPSWFYNRVKDSSMAC